MLYACFASSVIVIDLVKYLLEKIRQVMVFCNLLSVLEKDSRVLITKLR